MNRITVQYNNKHGYDIYLDNSFDALGSELIKLGTKDRKICIVSETNVAPLYMKQVKDIVSTVCSKTVSYVFEAGEKNKNLNTVRELYSVLIEEHFDRNDFLIALGGGVTGDLTGFAAATYLRGISFVQVPTTLLSQVDSSIGGKTGVDFDAYKNMVGAFHQPSLVFINYSTLKSLPEREFLSGMGEVIKHGLIKNKEEFYWLTENCNGIKAIEDNIIEHLLAESIKVKQKVVESDPMEKGERALLNFGHTIGHAIEKRMNFTLFHGECVSIGAVLAAKISLIKGLISEADYNDIVECFRMFELPVDTKEYRLNNEDLENIVNDTKNDKKMDGDKVKFILLNSIGDAVINKEITTDIMLDVLKNQ